MHNLVKLAYMSLPRNNTFPVVR